MTCFTKPNLFKKFWLLPLLALGLSGCLDNGGGAYVTAKVTLNQDQSQQNQARFARAAAEKTSLILAVPATVTAAEALHYSKPAQTFDKALEDLGSGSVTLRLPVGESIKLLKYTFNQSLSEAQIESQKPLPYNVASSATFEINAKTSDLEVTLFGNDLVFNQGRTEQVIGAFKLTMTGKQAFDAGHYNFSSTYWTASGETPATDDTALWRSYSIAANYQQVGFLENNNRSISVWGTLDYPSPGQTGLFRVGAVFADGSLPEQQATSWVEPKRATTWTMQHYNATGTQVSPTCAAPYSPCDATFEHQYEEVSIAWTDGLPTVTRTIKTDNRSLYKLVETYSAHPSATLPDPWPFSVFYPSASYYKSNVTLYENTATNTATTTTWGALGSWTQSLSWETTESTLVETATQTCLNSTGTRENWTASLTNYSTGAATFGTSPGYTFSSGGDWGSSISCSLTNSANRIVDTSTYTLASDSQEVTVVYDTLYYDATDTLASTRRITKTLESWASGRLKSSQSAGYTDSTFTTFDGTAYYDVTYTNGVVTKYDVYTTSGTTKTLEGTYTYTYDSQNRLTEYALSSWPNGVETPTYKVVYSRDENGRISSERSYYYTNGAYSTEATCVLTNRALNYSYSFPDAGGMTVTVQNLCSGVLLSTTAQDQWTVTYNARGQMTNRTDYVLSGTTFQVAATTDYTYDDNNNRTKIKATTYTSGVATSASGTQYYYDDQGARIGQASFSGLTTETVSTGSSGYTSAGTLVNFNNRASYTYQ